MKKIGIVTIAYGHNYGNKLQNYAMQEVYKKIGYDVSTIKFIPSIDKKKKYKTILKNMNPNILITKIKKTLNIKNYKENMEKRINHFSEFNKFIKYTKDYTQESFQNVKQENFDYYSVGSDQVWNPYFADFSTYYLLDFINSENKIAYAPSFGVSSIPTNMIEKFKKSLLSFKSLSCREDSGAELIKELTNKEVSVVVDPTMLLETREWDQIIECPKKYENKKYIVLYFLGKISKEDKIKIKQFALDNNCEIIKLLDCFSDDYKYGPSEFLGLIKNSYAVFTDSFHASLFSIMYKKPFLVFSRKEKGKSMSSRIETLLKKFNLENRKFNGNFKQLFDDNYNNVDKVLETERKKSYDYINLSLNK